MTKYTFKYHIVSWLPVVLLCFAIFYVSSYPTAKASTVQWEDFTAHKLAHLIEYSSLAILTFRALVRSGVSRREASFISVVFVLLFGSSDEIHQRFVFGRESRFRDVLIDTFGASLAILGIWKLLPKVPVRLKSWANKLDLL